MHFSSTNFLLLSVQSFFISNIIKREWRYIERRRFMTKPSGASTPNRRQKNVHLFLIYLRVEKVFIEWISCDWSGWIAEAVVWASMLLMSHRDSSGALAQREVPWISCALSQASDRSRCSEFDERFCPMTKKREFRCLVLARVPRSAIRRGIGFQLCHWDGELRYRCQESSFFSGSWSA